MKLVTIQMQLGFDNLEDEIDFDNKESIADYLTKMLYDDPDFFSYFGQENIIDVKEVE